MKTTKIMTTLAISIGMVASMVPVVANAASVDDGAIVKNTVIENSDITTETTEAKEHKVLCEIFMVEGNKPEDVLALIGADGTDYILSEDGTMFTCAITEEQAIKAKFCELVKCFQLNFSGNNDTPEHTVVYPSYPAESDTESVVITAKTYDCEIVKGDANCDGIVNMADAVTIMQYMANPNKYPISEQGRINGDIDENGLTNADAQAIQLMILNVIRNSSETEDSSIVQWNGKMINYNLYEVLENSENSDKLIAVKPMYELNGDFVYNGKTLAEYRDECDNERLLYERMVQLLKQGDELKYGEQLCTTGNPDGYKWDKDLYERTIEFIGKDLLSEYIINGEFLKDKLEKAIEEFNYSKNSSYNEAILNSKLTLIKKTVEQLREQNISYENSTSANNFAIWVTPEQFVKLSIDCIRVYGLAGNNDTNAEIAPSSAASSVVTKPIKNAESWTARKIFDNGEYSESVVLSAEETGLIKNYCYGCKYETGTADCINDYEFTMENGAKIYYHSDCGTFNDNTNELSYNTTDYMRDEINMILGKKSFWQLCQGGPLKNL